MKRRSTQILTAAILSTTLLVPSFGAGTSFKDLPKTHWAYSNIMTLANSGIISGYQDGTFKPTKDIRVDEFIVLMMRSQGHQFEATGYFAKPYIGKAIELNIINKSEFTDYTKPITREEMISIAVNVVALKETRGNDGYNPYILKEVGDIYSCDNYYLNQVVDAYKIGLTSGIGGKFLPKNPSSRAEASAIVSRVLDKKVRTPYSKADVKHIMIDKQLRFDANGKEVAWDEYDFNLKDTYTYKIVQVPFYAPYWNGKPLNEVVDFAKLLKDHSDKERGHLLFVAWDGSDNEPQSASVKGYKSKAFLDDRLDTSKYPESEAPFLLAERMDFDLSVEVKELSHKYSPYHMVLWRKDEHADGFKTYSAFFNSTYGDRIRPMFDFWFEDKADYAWNKFLNAMSATDLVMLEEVVNGRHYKIFADRAGISLNVSLKRF